MLIMSFIGQMIHLSVASMFWRLSASESLSGKERPLILNNHKISRLNQSFLKSALLALSQLASGESLSCYIGSFRNPRLPIAILPSRIGSFK